MKHINLLLSLSLALSACGDNRSNETQKEKPLPEQRSTSEENTYMQKYAGGYAIEVDGYNSNAAMESYVLKPNGDAKWILIVNDGNGGARKDSEKLGKWTAKENYISITINGNTGEITENYIFKKNRFQDDINGQRYLKQIQ